MSSELIDLFVSSFGETLMMVVISGVVGSLLGIPLGIALHITEDKGVLPNAVFNRVAGLLVNAVRSTPFIILLVAVIPMTRFFGGTSIGTAAAIVPLTIAAAPFIARLVETALRETFEETGIAPGLVTVAGYLERYVTGTGFDIQPVVGLVADGFALKPDPREVDAVFEVPLGFLLDPANLRHEAREIAGRERRFFAFSYDGHEIWGATAAIIVNLAERLA